MLDFLPVEYQIALGKINTQRLYEIRMRAGKPTIVRIAEEYVYLTDYGVSNDSENALISTVEELEETVYAAGKYSVYAVEEQLRQGFLTAEGGVRIGIAGRFIFEKGQPIAVRDFSSLCIRVPHEIIGSGEEIYNYCLINGLKNLLIVGPPGQGKTTILRDLARLISQKLFKNILICDERGEIGIGNVGETTDVYAYADKKIAMAMGIRVMRPDVIITDELGEEDAPFVKRATESGLKVIASLHAANITEILPQYRKFFEKIILLDTTCVGRIRCIEDGII